MRLLARVALSVPFIISLLWTVVEFVAQAIVYSYRHRESVVGGATVCGIKDSLWITYDPKTN